MGQAFAPLTCRSNVEAVNAKTFLDQQSSSLETVERVYDVYQEPWERSLV